MEEDHHLLAVNVLYYACAVVGPQSAVRLESHPPPDHRRPRVESAWFESAQSVCSGRPCYRAVVNRSEMICCWLRGDDDVHQRTPCASETGADGHHIWEMEAKVDKDAFKPLEHPHTVPADGAVGVEVEGHQAFWILPLATVPPHTDSLGVSTKTKTGLTTLLVAVPPYRNQRISSPVQVNFYICNGKRKRSQYQRFTYLPPNGKTLGISPPPCPFQERLQQWRGGQKMSPLRPTLLIACDTSTSTIPTIKTEPHDDYDLPHVCAQQHPSSLTLPSKPFYAQQALPSDNRACATATYAGGPQRLATKPSSLSCSSSSPSTSPKLQDLSPTHFAPQCLTAGASPGPAPVPHVSAIQPTPGRYQQPVLYPSGSASSSPGSHPSTPGSAPELVFSPGQSLAHSPVSSEAPALPKAPARNGSSPLLQDEGAPPMLAVSIKQEPQELDQMYLDDGYPSSMGEFDIGVESLSVESLSMESLSVESLSVGSLSVESLSVESLSVESLSVESLSVESLSVKSLSVEILSVDSLSVESLSVGSLSVESLSVESLSVESLSVGSLSVESLSVESLSVESLSVESLSVESLSVESLSVGSLSVESLSVESLSVESLSVESLSVESLSVESLNVESLSVESLSVSLSVESLSVENLSMESLSVESLSVESLSVENLSVKSLSVESLSMENLSGESECEVFECGESERGESECGESEREESECGESECEVSDCGKSECRESECEESERGESECGESERGGSERREFERGESERREFERGESECGEPECGESERGESECGESERGESERGESECGESERGESERGESEGEESERGESEREESERGESECGAL
ncbi:hypothetical protein NFI96_006724 [Prochilodus magdalenae]|nr:hypothetical protein NFI96_006724 [Prochilodus magdalenae]